MRLFVILTGTDTPSGLPGLCQGFTWIISDVVYVTDRRDLLYDLEQVKV